MKQVIFFPNGNTAVCEGENQVPELQVPWLLMFVEFLQSKGEDPEKLDITLPNGNKAKVFKVEGGYNWDIHS